MKTLTPTSQDKNIPLSPVNTQTKFIKCMEPICTTMVETSIFSYRAQCHECKRKAINSRSKIYQRPDIHPDPDTDGPDDVSDDRPYDVLRDDRVLKRRLLRLFPADTIPVLKMIDGIKRFVRVRLPSTRIKDYPMIGKMISMGVSI